MLSQDIEIDPSYYSCCRVCGVKQEDPWGSDGKSPSFNFCICCGVEFGYEDFTLEGTKEYREQWIKKGYLWFKPRFKPENWDPIEQMKNTPPEFRNNNKM